jgi:hypothetical protein
MVMKARCSLLFVLATGGAFGEADTAVAARLRAEFKESFAYVPSAAGEEMPAGSDGTVLELEPMVVTRPLAEADIMEESRRRAAAREAAKFSALKGGSLLTFRRGEIGFWPKIVPVDATPVKKADVALTIDLLRLKW